MKRNRKNQSEFQKVFLFLGVLFVLLVGSFFIGMYLGTDERGHSSDGEGPRVVTDHVLADSGEASQEDEQVIDGEHEEPSYPASDTGSRSGRTEETAVALKNPSPVPDGDAGKAPSSGPVSKKNTAKVGAERVYCVQVGAFREKAQAEALEGKLRKKGYSVYLVEEGAGNKGVFYRVRIGRYKNKKDAESLSLKIRKREGMQSFVAYR